MQWHTPPIIKVYEALGALADERVELASNSAKVFSSSRNKYYEVHYDPETQAIMANDNGSYWKGYLGYPAIAYLLKCGVIAHDERAATLLQGIAWKDINQRYKNDFDKTLEHILSPMTEQDKQFLAEEAERILCDIETLALSHLGPKTKPPEGY